MTRISDTAKTKYFANKGLARNKKPLANRVYTIDVVDNEKLRADLSYDKYKFKELGYLSFSSKMQGSNIGFFHGFITVSDLKNIIGERQYSKFCNGKREFIIQRRVNGKNIPKNEKI